MEHFIRKHADKIHGTLSCFDRILFRGHLPFFSGAAFAAFLDRRGICRPELKNFRHVRTFPVTSSPTRPFPRIRARTKAPRR